jgi:hypothetical protein
MLFLYTAKLLQHHHRLVLGRPEYQSHQHRHLHRHHLQDFLGRLDILVVLLHQHYLGFLWLYQNYHYSHLRRHQIHLGHQLMTDHQHHPHLHHQW